MTHVILVSPAPLYSGGMKERVSAKPLVFACSGCSFAGKLTDDLARRFDRNGDAERSCLAGIGAKRPGFIATPNGTVDIDGIAAQLVELVDSQT